MARPAEGYILLGLRLGRHVDGLVDAYYGPEALAQRVAGEPVAEPAALVEQADTLLAGLEDGWLHDQALGLRTYAGVLAGEQISYSDEVERCYGVRPEKEDTERYAAVHEELEALLPGTGPLDERYELWRRAASVPADAVVPALREVLAELRGLTAAVVGLPTGEEVAVEEVRDEPWWAFNYYQGGLRSRIAVNLDTPTTCGDVVHIAAHEVYPGHHTEHAVKEQLLVRDGGRIEEAIQLVPTPAAVLSEGIAEAAPAVVVDDEARARLAATLRRRGLEHDHELEYAVAEARRPLRSVTVDAALMIHEDGASQEEAAAYIRRWGLVSAERAAQSILFVTDPTWRAYSITYSAGARLCERWVRGDPARLARLLTEHVRIGDLVSGAA